MKIMKYTSLVIAICFATACRPLVTTTLEPDLFEQTLGQASHPQLVDVRTPQEYDEGYIEGAVLMDIKVAGFDTQILQLNPEQPVFVYCRSGKRSLEAAKILEKHKFKVVYNLGGGINAWRAKGKKVIIP